MPYESSFRWDENEVSKFHKAAFLNSHNASCIIICELLFVTLLAVSIKKMLIISIIICVLAMVAVPALCYLSSKAKIFSSFRTNKALQDTTYSYKFYEDRFEVNSDGSHTTIVYDDLHKIKETETNFYLFTTMNKAYSVRKSDCSEGLIDLFRSKN